MKIKQEPPDALIEKLKDTRDWQAWYQNAIMVGEFGDRAEPAIPILLEAVQHTNSFIQVYAIVALGMIGRQPDRCIPAILPFMTSPDLSDRQKAIRALRGFGTNAFPARTAIKSALDDPDSYVRYQAEIAMRKLGPMEASEDGTKNAEPEGPATWGQPVRSGTNRPSAAAGSGR
jgi:HEAT repeat protein